MPCAERHVVVARPSDALIVAVPAAEAVAPFFPPEDVVAPLALEQVVARAARQPVGGGQARDLVATAMGREGAAAGERQVGALDRDGQDRPVLPAVVVRDRIGETLGTGFAGDQSVSVLEGIGIEAVGPEGQGAVAPFQRQLRAERLAVEGRDAEGGALQDRAVVRQHIARDPARGQARAVL